MTAPNDVPVPDWRLTGDWWDLCNCAIGCPCNFGSNPTYGFCEGVLTWLIRDGSYGDLKFAKDLAVVLVMPAGGRNRWDEISPDACARPAPACRMRATTSNRWGNPFPFLTSSAALSCSGAPRSTGTATTVYPYHTP